MAEPACSTRAPRTWFSSACSSASSTNSTSRHGNCNAKAARPSRELPGIVDQIITYQFLDFGDGKPPTRGFVCTSPNPWGYPAKDRSGRLDRSSRRISENY